jgi:hypothetical protein
MFFQTPTVKTPPYWAQMLERNNHPSDTPFYTQPFPGCVILHSLNPHIFIQECSGDTVEHNPDFPNVTIEPLRGETPLPLRGYGVVDSPEQFEQLFKGVLENDPRTFITTLSPMYKSGQPKEDGWRWSKWGKYYGAQNSVREYLFDEPEIKKVYIFSIYKV